MNKKMWLGFSFVSIILAVAAFSAYISHCVTSYLDMKQFSSCLGDINSLPSIQKDQSEYINPEEDKIIYVAVALPDSLITGDDTKDKALVKESLALKDDDSVRYVKIVQIFERHIYIFKVMKKKPVSQPQ